MYLLSSGTQDSLGLALNIAEILFPSYSKFEEAIGQAYWIKDISPVIVSQPPSPTDQVIP